MPNVSASLSAALCSGDTERIKDALLPLRSRKVSEEERRSTLNALRYIWEEDKNFGTQLPWKRLTDTPNKAVLVDVLAQAYRNHESDVSLQDMQHFAVDVVTSGRDDEYYDGVWLLGVTDDKDQVPLLQRIALSNDPAARRHKAIEALGNICDASAMQALKGLSVSLEGKEPDATLIKNAMEMRADIEASWCRRLTQ